MTAAATVKTPLIPEGLTFWEKLVSECGHYTAAVNGAVAAQGAPPEHFLECGHDRELQIRKSTAPSTNVSLAINFLSWGPVIHGQVTGKQTEKVAFSPEHWEIPIAIDLDGAVVAVFDEGRSFSPRDLARYLVQKFRRCYPAVSLPCEYQSGGAD